MSDTPISALEIESESLPSTIERLGVYRILRWVGGGGMGDVYKAHDEILDRMVALKVLPPELARHGDFVRRFRAEAMAVAKLTHPNVVQVFACGEDGGRHYFAMQYVEGESLASALHHHQRLSVAAALPIFEQCLAGLAAAHQCGLIHRDIKPGNILLDRDNGRAMIADFGLVKTINDGEQLTVTGTVLGTVDYIAPEQARGKNIDCRADLYSFGALMFHVLSGQPPFESDSPTGIIFKHAFETPVPLSTLAPDVPRSLEAIVTKLLAKEPADRFQTAKEIAAAPCAFRLSQDPAQASSRSETKSRLISMPQFLSAASPSFASLPVDWFEQQGWRRRLWRLFHAYAPEQAKQVLDTQHQVDGAIIEYEQRRKRLADLIAEATAVAEDYRNQISVHRQLASHAAKQAAMAECPDASKPAESEQLELERIADDFAGELIEQEAQLDAMKLQLAKVDATLGQVRAQRNALAARLRTAEVQLEPRTRPTSAFRTRGFFASLGILLFIVVAYWGVHYITDSTGTAVPVLPPQTVAAKPDNSDSTTAPTIATTFKGITVRNHQAAEVKKIGELVQGPVPSILEGAEALWIGFPIKPQEIEADGVVEIICARDGPIYLAVSWGPNDRGPGDWRNERFDLNRFVREGWTSVGELPMTSSSRKIEYRGLLWRFAKRGETFRIRTRRAVAPMVIIPSQLM